MAVSTRLRHEVMRRDGHACKYCGATAPDVKLTIDHVVPTTLGGSDDPSNLVTACAACNAGKSATPPDATLVAAVDERAVQWSQAMQIAVARRTAEFMVQRGRTERFDAAWKRWSNGDREMPRHPDWRTSVAAFLAGGLTDEFLEDAVGLAMGKQKLRNGDVWRYFCGICWRELDHLRELTAAILQEPAACPVTADRVIPDIPCADDETDEVLDGFPFMEMFDEFLALAAEAGGIPLEARRILSRELWDVMPLVDKVWSSKSLGDPQEDAQFLAAWQASDNPYNEAVPSRRDLAVEFMSSYVAHGLYRVQQLCAEPPEDPSGS